MLEGIRRNHGPSEFARCDFNTSLLANALRGNSSIQRLENSNSDGDVLDLCVLALCRVIAHNFGLVYLDLGWVVIDGESWRVMCQSLVNHPTLERLDIPAVMLQ